MDSKDLGDGTYKIGRSPDSDLCLKSQQVSKQHGLLIIKGTKAAIVDLGSSNGTFVNGILIRKQRVEPRDDIVIADFKIKLGGQPMRREAKIPLESLPQSSGFNGNLATDFATFDSPDPEKPALTLASPQDRLLNIVDHKILIPFYKLLKSSDWRWILAGIIMFSLVSSVIVSIIPIVRWGMRVASEEALNRAHTIISQTVKENYRLLTKTSDYSKLTVDAAESEKGMLEAYVVDAKTKAILAPSKMFNKSLSDVWSLAALEKVIKLKGEDDHISLQQSDTIYIVAQPIYAYASETNQRNLMAIVVGRFQIGDDLTSIFEPLVEAALFATFLSLLAFFFIYKMMTYPISQMNDQLDAALKGSNNTITCEAKFAELENLATVMNFAISRLKKESGGDPGKINSDEAEVEDHSFVKSVKEFNEGSTDALLLLDVEKKVRFVGSALEELVGMRNQYAEGQNISDACKDPGLAGTVIDLTEGVVGNLGQTQYATLDINGVTRDLVAVAHKNSSGEIRFVLIIIKLDGGKT